MLRFDLPPAAARAAAMPPPHVPRSAPNWWTRARAVRFVPTLEDGLRLIGAPTDGLGDALEAAREHGWSRLTWRTTRVTAGFQLPEENLGRYSPAGEYVVAIVRMDGDRGRRADHAVYFGELELGSMRQDVVMAQCAELARKGLRTDLWICLPTTL